MAAKYEYCVNCGSAIRVLQNGKAGYSLYEKDDRVFCKSCWETVSKLYRIPYADTIKAFNYEKNRNGTKLLKCGIDYIESYLDWLKDNDTYQSTGTLGYMPVTSGFNFEGYTIEKYFGFFSSEIAVGLGLFKSITASISDIIGTESGVLSEKLYDAKEKAVYDLKKTVLEIGGNAIIGMDLDYTMFGGSLLGVIASGTAVLIKKRESTFTQKERENSALQVNENENIEMPEKEENSVEL